MRILLICLFLFCGCTTSESEPSGGGSSFFGGSDKETKTVLTKTMRTSGGESLKLEDGSELVLPEGIFSAPADVTFSRSRCGGIFASNTFSSCQYSVDFTGEPTQRFKVNLAGEGRLTSKTDDGYKPVGVLHEQTALTSDVFALRTGDEGGCVDVEFTACGGDLVGEWEQTNACGPRREILNSYSTFENDPYAVCGEGEWLREYPFTSSKKISFKVTGEYGESGSIDVKERRLLTQACLDTVGETCHETCTLKDGLCTCLYDESSGGSASGGYWNYDESSATTIVFNGPNSEEGEESGPGSLSDYCVDGDTLTVRDQGRTAVFVYRRK